MEKHTAYYELLKQLASPDCPVCALAARRTRAFLQRYLEEGVVHEDTWDRLAAAGGWCGRHAADVRGLDDGVAVALFYKHLLKKKAADLAAGKALLPVAPGVAHKAGLFGGTAQAQCPACGIEHETVGTQSHLLSQALAEPEAQAALDKHPGLCLSHVDTVLARAAAPLRAAFVAQQAEKLRVLETELELFIRRSEHGATEPIGTERDAWKRALKRYYGLGLGD
jgi:hypothetical protein